MTKLFEQTNERKVIGGNNADVRSRLDRCACFLLSDEVDWPKVVADGARHGCATEKVGEANQKIPFWGSLLVLFFFLFLSLAISESVTFLSHL